MTAAQPVALVTGESSGIGKAAALALVAAGFRVAGTSRSTSRATPRDGVTYLDLDVTGDESVTAAVQQVIERFGRIDALVNNAGVGTAGAPGESSVARAQGVFDVNVIGLNRWPGRRARPHAAPRRPLGVFDRQTRKLNRLAGVRQTALAAKRGNGPAASPRLP